LTPICTRSFVGWDFGPDQMGELTALPQARQLYFGDLLLKAGERMGEEESEEGMGEGRGGSSRRKKKSRRLCEWV